MTLRLESSGERLDAALARARVLELPAARRSGFWRRDWSRQTEASQEERKSGLPVWCWS